MLFMGVNCFQRGWRSTKSWCTARDRSTVTWNHFVVVVLGGGAEKGIGVGFEGVRDGVEERGMRFMSLLGLVMSEMSSLDIAFGRVGGSSSAPSTCV